MANAKKTFKYYSDPGHAWLAVRIKDLKDIGIDQTQFSSYSYIKGGTVYLEEDSDATKFLKLWKHIKKDDPNIVEKSTNRRSPIRSYAVIR